MFEITALLAYAAACFVVAIVPGPSVAVIGANSLARGPAAGLWTLAGTQIGVILMVLVVAFGFETIIGGMAAAFFWIKLVGAAYLIYLGFRMITGGGTARITAAKKERSIAGYMIQGFLVLWSNPKALLFLGAFLPQFVHPGAQVFEQIMVLGLIFMAIAGISDAGYALLAGHAGKALRDGRIKLVSRISGAVLMAGGAWLALQQK
ncbi:LysE family translocator [Cucumibacter marinus]|uniref:LysE family translocator n=1 Tax=Cucumibacter marinus TaxID=1121252 RepID=UPI000421E675|nr:LysE family translocator [Cucumibacter marinus]